jgi:hypothetical protein
MATVYLARDLKHERMAGFIVSRWLGRKAAAADHGDGRSWLNRCWRPDRAPHGLGVQLDGEPEGAHAVIVHPRWRGVAKRHWRCGAFAWHSPFRSVS